MKHRILSMIPRTKTLSDLCHLHCYDKVLSSEQQISEQDTELSILNKTRSIRSKYLSIIAYHVTASIYHSKCTVFLLFFICEEEWDVQ